MSSTLWEYLFTSTCLRVSFELDPLHHELHIAAKPRLQKIPGLFEGNLNFRYHDEGNKDGLLHMVT